MTKLLRWQDHHEVLQARLVPLVGDRTCDISRIGRGPSGSQITIDRFFKDDHHHRQVNKKRSIALWQNLWYFRTPSLVLSPTRETDRVWRTCRWWSDFSKEHCSTVETHWSFKMSQVLSSTMSNRSCLKMGMFGTYRHCPTDDDEATATGSLRNQ